MTTYILTYNDDWYWGPDSDPENAKQCRLLCSYQCNRLFDLGPLTKQIAVRVNSEPSDGSKLLAWTPVRPYTATIDGQYCELNRHAFGWIKQLAPSGKAYITITTTWDFGRTIEC